MTKSHRVRNGLIRNSRLLVLVVLFLLFTVTTDTFWGFTNWSNVRNIILQQAPFTILLALSMTLIINTCGFDLSIGSGIAAVSCTAAIVMQKTQSAALGILTGVFLGALVGLCNGILVAYVRIPTFIATYTMQWILRGVALVLMGGSQIYDFGPNFRNIFIGSPYTFLIICAAIVGLMCFVMSRTVFGRCMNGVGHNSEAAQLSGMNTRRTLLFTFLISGTIMGITALMYIANLGTAEASIGEGFNLTAIAATLVGGTTIGGGGGKPTNAVVGALIMLVLTNGMIQADVPSVWQQVVVGGVIIASVVAERGMQKLARE